MPVEAPTLHTIEPALEPAMEEPRSAMPGAPLHLESAAESAFAPTIEATRVPEMTATGVPATEEESVACVRELATIPEPQAMPETHAAFGFLAGPDSEKMIFAEPPADEARTVEARADEAAAAVRKDNGKSENGKSRNGLFGWLRRSKATPDAEETYVQPVAMAEVPAADSPAREAVSPPEMGEREELLSALGTAPATPEVEHRPHLELLRRPEGAVQEIGGPGEGAPAVSVHEVTVPVVVPADCSEVRLVVRLLVRRTSDEGGDSESEVFEARSARMS
jgi:hypothetical protein